MRGIALGGWLPPVVLLMAAATGFSQAAQQKGTLMVAGHSGQAPVTQFEGRSYVAIDALARLMEETIGGVLSIVNATDIAVACVLSAASTA